MAVMNVTIRGQDAASTIAKKVEGAVKKVSSAQRDAAGSAQAMGKSLNTVSRAVPNINKVAHAVDNVGKSIKAAQDKAKQGINIRSQVVGSAQTLATLKSIQQARDDLDGSDATMRVHVTETGARATEQKLQAVEDARKDASGILNVNIAKTSIAGLKSFNNQAIMLSGTLERLGPLFGIFKLEMMAGGIAAAIPLIGGLIGRTMQLSSAIGAGLAGAAVIGGTAIGGMTVGLKAYAAAITSTVSASREAFAATHANAMAQLEEKRNTILNTQAAKDFNNQLNTNIITLTRIQAAIGNAVFPIFTGELKAWDGIFQRMTPNIAKTSGTLAQLGANFSHFIRTARGGDMLRYMFQFINQSAVRAGTAITQMGYGALRIFDLLIAPATRLQERIVWIATAFNRWTASKEGINTIANALGYMERRMNQVFSITTNLGRVIFNVFAAVNKATNMENVLNPLVYGFQDLAKATEGGSKGAQKITDFMNDMEPALRQVGLLARDVGVHILKIAQHVAHAGQSGGEMGTLAEIILSIRKAVPDIARELEHAFVVFGPKVAELIPVLADFVAQLFGSTGPTVAFMESITSVLKVFNGLPQGIQNTVVEIMGFGAVASTLGGGTIAGLATTIGGLALNMKQSGAIADLATGKLGAMGPAAANAAGGMGAAGTAAANSGKKTGLMAKAMTGLKTAGAFLMTGAALPWIAALAGVAAAAFLIYKNWGKIKPVLQPVIDLFWRVVDAAQQAFAGLKPKIAAAWSGLVGWIRGQAQSFLGWWRGIWDQIKQFASGFGDNKSTGSALVAVFKVAKRAATAFVGFWRNNMGSIKTIAKGAWNQIKLIVGTTIKIIGNVIKLGLQVMNGNWRGAWNTIKRIVQLAWNLIKGVVKNGIKMIGAALKIGWNAVKNVTRAAWNAVKAVIGGIWKGIKALVGAAVRGVVNNLKQAWNNAKQNTQMIWNGIKALLSAVWNGIKAAATAFWNMQKRGWTNIWNAIKSITSTVWNAIKSAVQAVWNAIKSLATAFWNTQKRGWTNIWNAIKTITSTAWNGIKNTVTGVWDKLKEGANAFWNALKGIWENIKTGTAEAWKAVGNGIVNGLEAGWNAAKGVWNTILDGIAKALDALSLGGLADDVRSAKFAAGGTTDNPNTGTVERYAKGGIGTQNRKARIHEWNEGMGNEAFIAEKGPRNKQLQYLNTAASWFNAQVIPFARGGVTNTRGSLTGPPSVGGRIVHDEKTGSYSLRGDRPAPGGYIDHRTGRFVIGGPDRRPTPAGGTGGAGGAGGAGGGTGTPAAPGGDPSGGVGGAAWMASLWKRIGLDPDDPAGSAISRQRRNLVHFPRGEARERGRKALNARTGRGGGGKELNVVASGWNLMGGDGFLGASGSAYGGFMGGAKVWGGTGVGFGQGRDVRTFWGNGPATATTSSRGTIRADNWVKGAPVSTAVWGHEIGHAMGLGHSSTGLMRPTVTASSRPSAAEKRWVANQWGSRGGSGGGAGGGRGGGSPHRRRGGGGGIGFSPPSWLMNSGWGSKFGGMFGGGRGGGGGSRGGGGGSTNMVGRIGSINQSGGGSQHYSYRQSNVNAVGPRATLGDREYRQERRKAGFRSGKGEGLGPTHYNVTPDVRAEANRIAQAVGGTWNTYVGHGEPGGSVESRTVDIWGPGGRGSPIGSKGGYKAADMALASGGPPVLYIIRQGQYWRGGNWQAWPQDPHYDHTHISYTPNGQPAGGGGFNPLIGILNGIWNNTIAKALQRFEDVTSDKVIPLKGAGQWANDQAGPKIKDWLFSHIPGGSGGQGIGTAPPGEHGGTPAQNRSLGQQMASSVGWGGQWGALDNLWTRESGWSRTADNPTSAAYGIPQANPGSKMGANANPPKSWADAQISWGLGYIRDRYGDPNGAWAHSQNTGWYRRGTRRVPGPHGLRQPAVLHGGEAVLSASEAAAVGRMGRDVRRNAVRPYRTEWENAGASARRAVREGDIIVQINNPAPGVDLEAIRQAGEEGAKAAMEARERERARTRRGGRGATVRRTNG